MQDAVSDDHTPQYRLVFGEYQRLVLYTAESGAPVVQDSGNSKKGQHCPVLWNQGKMHVGIETQA